MLEQSVTSFFEIHTFFPILMLALMVFPRFTMLVGALFGFLYSGGLVFWLGWLILPRITIAMVASFSYWEVNPLLVMITWIWCLTAETGEKCGMVRNNKR